MFILKLECLASCDIWEACQEAQKIGRQIGIAVGFDFCESEIIVPIGADPNAIAGAYLKKKYKESFAIVDKAIVTQKKATRKGS